MRIINLRDEILIRGLRARCVIENRSQAVCSSLCVYVIATCVLSFGNILGTLS
jgi:hypothetical protein